MKALHAMNKKLIINYPCEWQFKLIGLDSRKIECAVDEIVTTSYQLNPSKQSSGGKYVSMTLVLTVSSEDERVGLYTKFKEHDAIKVVL